MKVTTSRIITASTLVGVAAWLGYSSTASTTPFRAVEPVTTADETREIVAGSLEEALREHYGSAWTARRAAALRRGMVREVVLRDPLAPELAPVEQVHEAVVDGLLGSGFDVIAMFGAWFHCRPGMVPPGGAAESVALVRPHVEACLERLCEEKDYLLAPADVSDRISDGPREGALELDPASLLFAYSITIGGWQVSIEVSKEGAAELTAALDDAHARLHPACARHG